MKPAFSRYSETDPLFRNGRVSHGEGCCSLWWSIVPEYPGERLGLIGEYTAGNDGEAQAVLECACRILRESGCTMAVGPMNGSTWQSYRFVTERGSAPPFFMEPWHPEEWPDHFRAAGFEALAEYFSAVAHDLTASDPRLERVEKRLPDITIRPLHPGRFEEEMRAIYRVSAAAFVENFLYTPLNEAAFMKLYQPIEPHVRPELVLLAEDSDGPCGYVFTLPDLAQAQRGEKVDTLVVKTLAVLPGRRHAGLGALLLSRAHHAAHESGFRRAIHALMHETNASLNLSGRSAEVFRRYTLFSKRLSP